MTRVARLLQGLGALCVLVAMVAGVPWALVHFVGWPLPHHVPTAAEVGRALDHQGIPAQTLVDALAVVVWVAWATLLASLAVEVPAALAGRHAGRLPLAGAFQPLTGRLVAAVVVACLTLAPRPAHPTPGLSTNPGGTLAPRPTPALVVRDDAFTARLTPVRTSPALVSTAGVGTAAPAQTTGAAPPSPAPVVAPRVYVVQRGDTLWGIAERELGDPLEWSEIFQMNEGRLQPGGATLTEPHWIDPGWTLLLPAASTTPPPAPSPPGSAPPVSSPAPLSTPATPPSTTSPAPAVPTTTTPTTSAPPTSVPNGSGAHAHEDGTPSEPVRLPSGSVVAGSFAAGVLSAVALGRLRRRHAYRYRPPVPGRNLAPDPLRPTLRHLSVAAAETTGHRPLSPDEVPAMADDDPDHRERPDLVEIGARDHHRVALALSELAGITVTGPTAPQVVGAWVTALMTRAGPRAAEIVATRFALDEVFGHGGCPETVPGLRVLDDLGRVLGLLERTVLTRARQLAEAEVPDVVAYRQANPWEPVPMILAIVDRIPQDDAGRWTATTTQGPRLGFAAINLDPDASLPGHLTVGEDRVVTAAVPDELATHLVGIELFGLTADEAADVIATLAESEERPDSTDGDTDLVTFGDSDEPEVIPWPIVTPPPDGDGHEDQGTVQKAADQAGLDEPAAPEAAPVVITVFGPYEIAVAGEVVSRGLRTVAKELLAWLCLRPEGASVEAAVDALWPDTERAKVHKVFWLAAANLRTRLGAPSESESKVLVASGDVYRLDPDAVSCDLWAFQQALATAARAEEDRPARDALRRAVDAYGGDLLVGTDYCWVEAVRQDLHRRALDAHLRLAEIDARLGNHEAATDTLRRAIDLDRYAEEPYRRLMKLHAERGRLDAVVDTWKLLNCRLAEIDVDPEPATERLYHSLTRPPASPADRARRARLSS
jgi:DNA-binding SARP family transcriptional activator